MAAVFPANQVRHMYIVKNKMTPAAIKALTAGSTYPNPTQAGSTALSAWANFDYPANGAPGIVSGANAQPADAFQFLYVNAHGQLIHSDVIWRNSIRSVRLTPAEKLRIKQPTYRVKLDTTNSEDAPFFTANSITPAAGDGNIYYLHIEFQGFQNASDEEFYTKDIAFEWKTGKWCDAAIAAIKNAFEYEHNMYNNLISVVNPNASSQSDDGKTFEIWSNEGTWVRGLHSNKPTQMRVSAPQIEVHSVANLESTPGADKYRVRICGTSENITATTTHTLGNGKNTADLEWYSMGERADQHRMNGYPNYVPTDYMVTDVSKEYDYLDVHFFFEQEGVPGDKSEKVLTLAMERAANSNSPSDDLTYFYNVLRGAANPVYEETTSGGNSGGTNGEGNGN